MPMAVEVDSVVANRRVKPVAAERVAGASVGDLIAEATNRLLLARTMLAVVDYCSSAAKAAEVVASAAADWAVTAVAVVVDSVGAAISSVDLVTT